LMADWMEGMTFALGASIATTKKSLAVIGGLEPIANMLSDDYELGNRIAQAGSKVLLSEAPVWNMYPAQSLSGFLHPQVRWARTVRLCRPLSYIGLIFTHGLPWAVLAAVFANTPAAAAGFLGAYFVARLTMAYIVGVWGVRDDLLRRRWYLVPLRDAVNLVIWLASFASNRVTWAGQVFQ